MGHSALLLGAGVVTLKLLEARRRVGRFRAGATRIVDRASSGARALPSGLPLLLGAVPGGVSDLP